MGVLLYNRRVSNQMAIEEIFRWKIMDSTTDDIKVQAILETNGSQV